MAILVIGNGESRLNFNWQALSYNQVIGCNAIHRDLTVDHLVCCDRRMVNEAIENKLSADTQIYVRESNYEYFRKIRKNKNIHILPNIPFVGELKRDQPDHWGSGAYAVLLAAEIYDNEIILIGFDLYGIKDKINNVYKNTVNYNKSSSSAIDYNYWVHQIAQVFRYYPQKRFIIINDRNWLIPKEWILDNVTFRNFEEALVDNKYLCN